MTCFCWHNLTAEVSKLSFCRVPKVAHQEVQQAHLLAKHALASFVPHPDTGDGSPFQPDSSLINDV